MVNSNVLVVPAVAPNYPRFSEVLGKAGWSGRAGPAGSLTGPDGPEGPPSSTASVTILMAR